MAPNSLRSSKTRRALLAFLLVVAEPAGLALVASNLVTTIADRGAAAIAWLVVRLLITGFGAGVGMALWRERPGALKLARWAVGLAFAAIDDHRAHADLASPAASRRPRARDRAVVRLVCGLVLDGRSDSDEFGVNERRARNDGAGTTS